MLNPGPDHPLRRWRISRASVGFLASNACGIALYVFLFLNIIHRIEQEQREGPEFADGMDYLFTAFPVLAAFVAFNTLWLIASLWHHRQDKDYGDFILVGVIALGAWGLIFFGLRYA